MLTFDQAKEIALNKIGPENGLIEEETIEKPYGWYFQYQSLTWLKSRDWQDALVDSGGFIVDRESGRVHEFESSSSAKRSLAAYEYGLKYDLYDLYIIEAADREKTALYLKKLRLTYEAVEETNGRTWRGKRDYMPSQLATKLADLPCIFDDCRGMAACYEIFLDMDQAKCCKYQLIGRDVK